MLAARLCEPGTPQGRCVIERKKQENNATPLEMVKQYHERPVNGTVIKPPFLAIVRGLWERQYDFPLLAL